MQLQSSLLVGPLVFFSIAESILGFSDMKTFGRVGAKVIGMYICTTIVAIFLALGVTSLLQPGDSSMLASVEKMLSTNTQTAASVSVSLKDTLLDMIPSNFFNSFITSNMIQIIIIAVMFGLASKAIGDYSNPVQNFIKSGNALFQKMVEYVSKLLPIAVFCMMAKLMVSIDYSIVSKIIKIFLCCLVAFTTCSSSVTMPTSMKCLDRFGVSPKIYSFSIPLGATINMDGACIDYIILVLAMVRIYGIELNGAVLVSFCVTVLLLSVGTPAVPGAGTAFFMLLLTQVGIPAEAVAFIIPINTLSEFFETAVNVAGDGVVSTIVAKTEKMLNRAS